MELISMVVSDIYSYFAVVDEGPYVLDIALIW